MLSEILPCFQLLRMGPASPGDSPNRDLYTFRPSKPSCIYRLGRRADVCDVVLVSQQNPALISRIHVEIHAERDADSTAGDWRVSLVDFSAHGEFWEIVCHQESKREIYLQIARAPQHSAYLILGV